MQPILAGKVFDPGDLALVVGDAIVGARVIDASGLAVDCRRDGNGLAPANAVGWKIKRRLFYPGRGGSGDIALF